MLERILRPAKRHIEAERDDYRAEYERLSALIGRAEYDRVLMQRHADAAVAEAARLRAGWDDHAAARAAAEAVAAGQAIRCPPGRTTRATPPSTASTSTSRRFVSPMKSATKRFTGAS